MRKAASSALFVLALIIAPTAHAQPSGEQQAPASRQERLTSADSYLPMETITAGVLLRFSYSGMLVVDAGIDVPDAALRHRAQLNGPRLQDALRTAVATYATIYYRDRTAPDPTVLTRLMQQSVDRTLGAPGARVLLTNIIYQRRVAG